MRYDIKLKVDRLSSMSMAELSKEHLKVIGEVPITAHKQRLIRKLAWEYQCEDVSPISETALKRAKTIAKSSKLKTIPPAHFKTGLGTPILNKLLLPGVVLVKNYKGKRYEVAVTERGFMYNGKNYSSISAVAKAITGTHWNGKRFFGIK